MQAFIQITEILGLALLVAVCVSFALLLQLRRAATRLTAQEERIRKLERSNYEPRLESLEARLNPHLFKNILNSIQSHAYQTYHSIDKLAQVLDYILYESKSRFVPLREELEFASSLIEINRIKLSPLFQLKVKYLVDEADPLCNEPLIAPLICADLIENAFKHADAQSSDAYIHIQFQLERGVFTLSVSNKISPKAPLKKNKSGIGSPTLAERLEILYKNCYTLERNTQGDNYIAQLKIHLHDYKDQMPVA